MVSIFFLQTNQWIISGSHLLFMMLSAFFHPQIMVGSRSLFVPPNPRPDETSAQMHLSIHNGSSVLYKSVARSLSLPTVSHKIPKIHPYRVRLYVIQEEEFDELCFPRRFPDSESPWFALLSLTEFCSSAESVKSLIKEVLKFQRLTLQGVLLYTESSKLTYTVASLFNRSALSDEPFEVFIVPKDLAPDLALQCAASNSTCFLSLGLPFAPDQMSELGMSNNLQSSRIFPPGVQKKAKQSDQHHVESSRFDEVSSGNTSIASRNNVRLFEILGLDKSALASGHDPASSSASNLSVLTSGSTHHPSQVLSSPSPRLSLVSPRVRYDNTSAVLHAKLDNAGPGSSSEDALLNRSSVLFVAVSFILLMIISLGWLIFYYIQRFRYLHSKERASRRLAELARKAVARIPVKLLRAGDKEIGSNGEHCAICIEPYRPFDNIRILPCRHYFHKVCIDPWLLEQRSCPMCKLDILQAYGLRPYLAFSVGEDSSLSHGGGGFHTDESGPTVEEATTTAALTTESPSVSYLSQPQQSSCAPDSTTITDTCAGDSLRGKYAAVNDRKTRASATANSGGYQTCSEAGILGVESPTRALGSQSMDAEGTVVAANVAVTRSLSGQSSSPLLSSPAPLCATDYSPPFSTCLCAHTHSPTIGGSSPAEQCQRQHRLNFQQKMRAQSSDSSITQSNSSSQVVSQQQHKHLLPHLQPSDTQTLTSLPNPSKGDLAFVGSHLHHHRPNALTCTDTQTTTPPSHNSASGACGSSWDVGTSTSNHEENECHGDVNCDSSGSCRRQQKAHKRGSEGPFVGWLSRGFYLNKPSVRHHDKGDKNVVLPETFSSRFRHRRPPKDSSDAGGGGGGAGCPVSVKLMPHSPSASGLDPSVIEPPDDEAALVGCRLLPQQPQQTYDESCSVAPSQPTPGACKEQLVVAVVEIPSSSAAHSSSGRDPATGDSALMT